MMKSFKAYKHINTQRYEGGMDPSTINLIISLISGLVGGNIAGAALAEKSLGAVGNSIAGLLGGGIGGYILKTLGLFAAAASTNAMGADPTAMTGSSLDLTTFLANVGGSGVGGAVLAAIGAFIKNAVQK